MLMPVILSGGAGSRLWPVSREAYPKPFIRLGDGKTLLRKTFERAASVSGVGKIMTVTNREYYFLTQQEFQQADTGQRPLFMLEPCRRNTAPAVAMAALHALSVCGDGIQLLVLPADHLIDDAPAFCRAVAQAQTLAREGMLVTFGISPTHPESGYGYIECGAAATEPGCYRVERFVEKPPLDLATEFVASGRFLWNSGIFCLDAAAYLDALKTCAPDIWANVQACWAATDRRKDEKIDLDAPGFSEIRDVSIDYAVMEKHGNVAVVRADFEWNDIGSWDALGELTPADANGNRLSGEAIMVGATNCYVQSDSRVVAAVGVENLIIVDTPDALLVSDKSCTQDVRRVVSLLKLNNHPAQQVHRTVHRPWGSYTVLDEGPMHKIKRILVKPGASLSLQMHHHRSEHWVVLNGCAEVVNGDRVLTVSANESTFIPAGTKHRLANHGEEDLTIIEVQTGSYVGEDDIVRYEDVYGRI